MQTLNLILPNDISETSAAKNRTLSYINVLKDKYKINLITYSKDKEIKIQDVDLYFIDYVQIEKSNFIKRAFNEISLAYKLVSLSNKIYADYTLLTIPTMFLLPMGIFIKTKKIIDIRDLVWEYLDNGPIKNILRFIMLKSIKFYDKVTITNEYEKKYLKQYNPILISNGISQEQFNELKNLNIQKPKKFTVTYIGNIGIAQDLLILCKVAKELPEIQFKIIGDGVEFQKLQRYIIKNNIKNIKIPGKMNWEEIKKEYKKSSVLFAKLNKNFFMAMPSKLYEYASTGLPIIYIGEGEAKKFIKKLDNSYIIENKVEDFIELLNKIKNKNLSISAYNINFIQKNYIREKQTKKILEIIKKI